MSIGELLLTLIVALFVFGPKKLPMVAHHLGKLVGRLNGYKQQVSVFWQQQLQENTRKAEKADAGYLQAKTALGKHSEID